jgi:CHASE3 domain sensor protein
MQPELEELKQQIATRMENEQEANERFARRAIVVALIIIVLVTSLSIALFGS